MYYVDTSVLIAVLLPQDPHHRAARKWLEDESIHGIPFVTSLLAVVELSGFFSRRVSPRHAEAVQTALTRIRLLEMAAAGSWAEILNKASHVAGRFGLPGGDAIHSACALLDKRIDGLVTFDKDFLKIKSLIPIITPML